MNYNEKIAAVLASTLKLIQTNGFHGTPMSKIAQDSDVAIGTIYHYFPSKDDLIFALFKHCRTLLNDYIFDGIRDDFEYRDSFFHIWRNFVKFYLENGPIFSFFEQFFSSPYYEKNKAEIQEPLGGQNKVVDFLQEGIDRKILKQVDVHLLVASYIGVALSTVHSIKFKDLSFSEQNVDILVGIIWDGAINKENNN
ncbi:MULTISPECIES: TetR/AcrR family transcriptional regulator [unclassified Sphingobacterium]|uniref:TetR/AcrR family transcriptional regulator n=1 Tax=unclassified Sphingobacterium TaxID=2609468 RepID=UPI0025E5F4E9|nr:MULTISPECIES: TetR/AcrR family transcriptional regulator [unclassified Sphingobacterium]